MNTIKLTEKEAELIQHRWECPDCLADVFAEQFDANSAFEEAFWVAYEEVGKMLDQRKLSIESPEQTEVVKECCDGSVWVACCTDESDAVKRAASRTASSLENKLASIGIKVNIPRE